MKTHVVTFRLSGDDLSRLDLAAESLDEASRRLPDGIYTTFRTFDGTRFLHLHAHLDRLEDSARVLGRDLDLDRSRLCRALADVLVQARFPESRLRLTIPLEPGDAPPAVYVSAEPFAGIDPHLYAAGVRAITMLIARVSPRAKATGFIAPSRTLKAGLPREVYEVLMVTADGRILEGFTSNFFAFVDGRLNTAAEGVLEGITRSIILALAEELCPVRRQAPRVTDIPQFDEAFITSSARGVLPVVVINAHQIGAGKPGELTQRLGRRYDEYVRRTAEPPVPGLEG